MFATPSNHLWEPCRLYPDKFPVNFSYKILLNSTSILWWPPEGPGHLSKMRLCHLIPPDATSLPHGPLQAAPEPHLQNRNCCLLSIDIPNQTDTSEDCSYSKIEGQGGKGWHFPKSEIQWGWQLGAISKTNWKGKMKSGKWNGRLFPRWQRQGSQEALPSALTGLMLHSACLCVTFLCFQFCGGNCSFYQQSTTASKHHRNSPRGIWESLTWSANSSLVPKENTVPSTLDSNPYCTGLLTLIKTSK